MGSLGWAPCYWCGWWEYNPYIPDPLTHPDPLKLLPGLEHYWSTTVVMESWQHVPHWMPEDIEARKVVAADLFFKRQLAAKERFFKRQEKAKMAADRFFKESEDNVEKMWQLAGLCWTSEKIFRQIEKYLTDSPNNGQAITATGPSLQTLAVQRRKWKQTQRKRRQRKWRLERQRQERRDDERPAGHSSVHPAIGGPEPAIGGPGPAGGGPPQAFEGEVGPAFA